jgi:cell division transport system permease protein
VLRDRLDLPLTQTATSRVLPWAIGALIYAAVVLLAILIVADRTLLALNERARLATVTLPLADEAAVHVALEVLQRERAVLAATPVADEELRAFMTSWLGETDANDLPWAAMIDVRLDPGAEPDPAALQRALSEAVPGASLTIDQGAADRAAQLAAMVRAWSGLLLLGLLPAGLLALGALTRLGLRLCRDGAELMRHMGASPGYQADQLERHALACGLRGGACGLGFGLITVAALLYSARTPATEDALGLRPLDWGLLAGMAATSLLLAVAVVRATAYWQLQKGR